MSRILIISRPQFGYHTDIYKWCQYLRDSYEVSVVTFDDGKEKMSIPGVKNIYVPNARLRVLRGILFMLVSAFSVLTARGIILVCYFKQSILYKQLFPWKRMILDIRTLDVSKEESERNSKDASLRKCAGLYDFVTYISEGVREKACVPHDKSALLPLGAEAVPTSKKCFDKLNLLYVGTLDNRNIETTVRGLALALKSTTAEIEYDIVGDGPGDELQRLKACIKACCLESHVHAHGYVCHERLTPFFEKCNVGVSFVPMTDYYDFQPPTKTFEYALAGLYVIATGTSANREVITAANGRLIKDTAESFADALKTLSDGRGQIDSEQIRISLKNYEWRNIVDGYLKPILETFDRKDENSSDK